MIEVHPPTEPILGWKEFLIHLGTITIGLLIALSLEGTVEWLHHKHLVHEAEASLYSEISDNAKGLQETADDIKKQQEILKQDVTVLKYIIREHKPPESGHMEINFHIRSFHEVSWKTAQSTGALSYMPYEDAQSYSEIYKAQEDIDVAQNQAARDAILSLAPFMNEVKGDPDPTEGQASAIKDHIEILQGQLLLLNSLVVGLNEDYKKFLGDHKKA